jgi:threonine synthase
MPLISTRTPTNSASWRKAVLEGLAPDGGLYLPHPLPTLACEALSSMRNMSLSEIALAVASPLLGEEVPVDKLRTCCERSFSFPLPLTTLQDNLHVLELFHGPTCAFKDFGARFMSHLFRYFLGSDSRSLTVLVATSGDTGGAVANAFHSSEPDSPIRVVVLYPRDKVTRIQELQMTTLGGNVVPLQVDGTFDDCQRLVKTALADRELLSSHPLTTANSINVARLLPQILYYVYAWSRLPRGTLPVFCVPSGNLGNLTGGVIAHLLGLPVLRFVAACNRNDSFVRFLRGEPFAPHPSFVTHSNAMDVGNPSNFERLTCLASLHRFALPTLIQGVSVTDEACLHTCRLVNEKYGYTADPHTSIGLAAVLPNLESFTAHQPAVVLATAHPAKFSEVVVKALGVPPALSPQMEALHVGRESKQVIPAQYEALRRVIVASSQH